MHFLAPAFLIGALVAALPVALHLMGRRPQMRVVFPAVRLLRRSPAQETRRRRLRDLLLLALRVSAIGLLALAFARPYLARAVMPPRADVVVVAVDRSFSMSAPGQFQRAVSRARSAINGAPAGASVALLAFDDEAVVAARPSADRGAALAALDRLQPGYGSTSYGVALGRAADAIGPAGRGRIVVITDLQSSGWDRRDVAIPDRIDVVVEDVGGPASNLSVGGVRTASDGVTAVVRDSGNAKRSGRARLTVDGQMRGVVPFSVDAGAATEIAFPIRMPATGAVSVEIDDSTGYQADNRAYALLDAPEPPALLAITGDGDSSRGSFYLERALGVDNGTLFRLDAEAASRFSTHASVRALQAYSGLLMLGTRGLTRAAVQAIADYAAGGGGVLLALDDRVEASSLDPLFGARLAVTYDQAGHSNTGLLSADVRHPILQSFDPDAFAAVRFERLPRVQLQNASVLARFANGAPAILEQHHGAGRVLVFASDLSNHSNDLPLHPAFLPLVHQIARYLAGGRLPAREFSVSSVPAGVDRRPGVAVVRGDGEASGRRRVVVNVDPRESDVARMTTAEFQQVIARSRGASAARTTDVRQAEQQQNLWRFAIVFALIALLAEGLLGRQLRA